MEAPWHLMQRASRIGLTSLSKETSAARQRLPASNTANPLEIILAQDYTSGEGQVLRARPVVWWAARRS